MRKIDLTVSERDGGRRIRDVLRDFGVSSALLTRLRQTENGITVNGVFQRTVDTVQPGDILTICIADKGTIPRPRPLPVTICYEDEDLLVLNKPPQMPVHESRNHIGDTLSNFVAWHTGGQTAFRAVYRLDRDTSGLVVVAKHELAAAKLAGRIDKDYYAVVAGMMTEDGTVDLPIARCGDSIIKRRVDADGEPAVTHYEVLSHRDGNTLLRLRLATGRTHQIRVHLSYLGHPLLGDTLYGNDAARIARQALHCKDVYFTHPITGKAIHISCDFPQDMKEII
ncbi:MAG: RluA family pseudouridine synthase [Eubacterium sp.]|nr:RluA family pseudouridine synthase [Eubacterium sp.]